jgi:putative membrane protein
MLFRHPHEGATIMNVLSTATAAALLAAGATIATAQTQSQTPPDTPNSQSTSPSAASSPHQREATGTNTNEASTKNGANPSSASSPHQHQAMSGASSAEIEKATKAGATPATFVAAAAQDGMAEVELGKLALSKSNNDDVKQFAQKMVDEHGQANQQLLSIAKSKGLTVPTSLDAKHEAMVKSLSAKSGTAFDRAYAQHMATGHANAVALFESASKSSDPELAAFAQKTLPTLQEHEQLANNLRAATHTRTASAK